MERKINRISSNRELNRFNLIGLVKSILLAVFFICLSGNLVQAQVPSAPSWISSSTLSTNRIDLAWQRTTNTTSYTLYINTANNSGTASIHSGTADPITNISSTGLALDTSYFYWIKSFNAAGGSVFSSVTSNRTADMIPPTVLSTIPIDLSASVPRNGNIIATFSKKMGSATITTGSFKLRQGSTPVPGTVSYVGRVATFHPSTLLSANTSYTATITTNAKDLVGNAMVLNRVWGFTTTANISAGLLPVDLLTASNFVILAKSGISTVPTSAVTGDVGISPAAATLITGFSLSLVGTYATASQVVGKVYAADYTAPTPANMTIAINDMQAAYVDAAGRPIPDSTELGAGEIGGLTLVPGLYKWATGVGISADLTLDGGPNDVWIFQIAGGITMASGVKIILAGGAQAKNIFWQTFGAVMVGTTAHFEGIILSQTEITLNTGSSINGRLMSQTAVNIKKSVVTSPTILSASLSAPTWISTAAVSTNQISLLWKKMTTATSYTLYYGTINSTNSSTRVTGTTVNVTNFTQNGLSKGTSYFYWLKAFSSTNRSPFSLAASNATLPAANPVAPVIHSAIVMGTNRIDLKWQRTANTTSYTLYINTANNPGTASVFSGRVDPVTNTSSIGLIPNTKYFYWVKSFSATGNSAFSSVISNRTSPLVPTASASHSSVAIGTNQIDLSWQRTANTTSYTLYINTVNISGSASVHSGTADPITNASSTGLLPNISYFYWIKSFNATGGSAFSSVISNKTSDQTPPTVIATIPLPAFASVPRNGKIIATFSEKMGSSTITTGSFKVRQGSTPVPGTVSYVGRVATFQPSALLSANTSYTATITTNVKDLVGNAMVSNRKWGFATSANISAGLLPVNLLTASNFVILAKSGIDTVPTSAVTGNIGVSPAAATYITGFSLSLVGTYATASQVVGKVYAADYTVPTPANMTTAINDMQAAYVDAAGRPIPDSTELGAGEIGGLTLVPGLYKWGTGLGISTDLTLDGGPNDVWIFQIAGGITMASGVKIILAGGAEAKNVFWQTFGAVMLGTTAHFEGIILSQTEITLNTGSSINGRLMSQTAVNIKQSVVTSPTPFTVNLSAPTWISTAAVSTNQIGLLWKKMPTATSYTLYYGTINSTNSSVKLTGTAVNVTNFIQNGLSKGTSYFYWLKAFSSTNRSPFSLVASNKTLPAATGTPEIHSAIAMGTNRIDLKWKRTSNTTTYTLFINTVNNSGTALAKTGKMDPTTNFSDKTLATNTLYYYWVKSYRADALNTSVFSATVSNRTLPAYPLTPGFTSATGTETNQIALSWNGIGNATSYTLFRSAVNSTDAMEFRTGLTAIITNYTDTGLLANTRYYYWVRAYNGKGSSPFSTVISAMTKLPLAVATELDKVQVGPNPYKPGQAGSPDHIMFVDLPPNATITVYNVLGRVLTTLTSVNRNGQITWDVTAKGTKLAGGIYLCRIDDKKGNSKIFKLVIMR